MSKKVTKTVGDCVILNKEVHNLMQEDSISFSLKWDLKKLIDRTKGIVKNLNELDTELFKKFNVPKNDKTGEWDFTNFDKLEEVNAELKTLRDKKETFTEKFKKKDFLDLKSKYPYIHIMDFIE